MAFDRILLLKETDIHFDFPSSLNVTDYFKYCYGVYEKRENAHPQKIYVAAIDDAPCYLRDKPMHNSQKEIFTTNEFTLFQFHMYPTNDFMGDILQQGGRLIVLSPDWLKEELIERAKKTADKFKLSFNIPKPHLIFAQNILQ